MRNIAGVWRANIAELLFLEYITDAEVATMGN